jgi:hypothetical protein
LRWAQVTEELYHKEPRACDLPVGKSNGGSYGHIEDPLLDSLLKPDAATYNAVSNVLAQASGCPGDKRCSYPRILINNTYDSNYTITQPFHPKINGSTNNVSFAELSEMIVAQIEKWH